MSEIQEKIQKLEGTLTGNFMKDMEVKEEIHKLTMEMNNVAPVCSLEEGCISCGS